MPGLNNGALGLSEGTGLFVSTGLYSGPGLTTTVYDSSAIAVFNSFTTPPTNARKTVINNLVVALKAAGVWGLLDLLYMTAAADSQAGTINWKNPGSRTLVNVGAGPSFVADRGFTGNGSSTALNTTWAPSVSGLNYTQNDASLWGYCLTNSSSNSFDIGNASNPVATVIFRAAAGNVFGYANASVSANVATATSVGFTGIQRRGATDTRLWKDGSQIFSSAAASTGLSPSAQWICGANATNFSARQIACAAWGASLTGKEAAFYAAVLAYMQAVGAA